MVAAQKLEGISRQAAVELYNRRQARTHALAFTQYTYPRYQPDLMHQVIAEHLDKVLSGEIKRLMVFAPPQHGKTTLCTVHLPGLWLGQYPNDPVAIVTYGAELAEPKSREARTILEGPEYQRLFPDRAVSRDVRAMAHWQLANHQGYVHAVGIGGGITGHGFMLGIVDDPHKDYEEAMSKSRRLTVVDYYRNTFTTRLRENARQLIIMTRWHEDDICGHLLQEEPGRWTILRIPAMCESQDERDFRNRKLGMPEGLPDPLGRKEGEPCAPRRFSRETLLERKAGMPEVSWNAQYMGFPTSSEGGAFKRASFTIVESVPNDCTRIRYWDKAGTARGGAYSCGVLLAFHRLTNQVYIEDVVRGQWSISERERIIKQTAMFDRLRFGQTAYEPKIWMEQEPGSAGKESAEHSKRNLLLAGFSARSELPSGEKEVRAQPLADWVGTFGLKIKSADWNVAYIDELISVPNGVYWDQVDATTGAFSKIMKGGSWSRRY